MIGMGRPPLPLGAHGQITATQLESGWEARCRYRDYDGTTRQVRAVGRTKAQSIRNLQQRLHDRRGTVGIASDTKVSALAEQYLVAIEASDRASNTKQHYRYCVERQVLPTIGRLRASEVTPAAIDRALAVVRERHGSAASRTARTVMTGIFAIAVRNDLIDLNPVRETTSIPSQRKQVRALTSADSSLLIARLREVPRAVEHDVPDLVEWMLATGCRIGEAMAARDETIVVDQKKRTGTWEIDATVIRVKGAGMQLQRRPKTAAGWRVLALPGSAVDLVVRRATELRLRAPEAVLFPSPRAKALRDPSNTQADLRVLLDGVDCEVCEGTGVVTDDAGQQSRCDAGPFAWVTSHTFRKTVATRLDEAGLSARQIADQLGHARPSMTQDVYMGRQVVNADAARILDRA